MKKGFTLVELSIVLVIIGLLIGGILVGQSLIESARIQKFVRTLDQIDSAIALFESKFKKLPGDSPFHDAAGDGDGEVENSITNGGATNSFANYNFEVANFWRHLQQDNFLDKEYDTFSNNASTTGLVPGTHFPTVELGEEGGIVVVHDTRSTATNYTRYYYVCGYNTVPNDDTLSSARAGFLTPIEALSIDTKLDDGVAGGLTSYIDYTERVFARNDFSGVSCTSGSDYDASSDDPACCLRIRLGVDYKGY